MTQPNFLLLGAPKAGTTALYAYLQQHPQVFMSAVKEPHFFAFEGHSLQFNGPRDERGSLTTASVNEWGAYQALFAAGGEAIARGEASTMYLYWPGVPERIHHYTPDAKLVAILRNPIDRAFSHFLHLRRDGREWLSDFELALGAESDRIAQNFSPAWHYHAVGQYAEQLQRYRSIFPHEQLKIYLYDDWRQHPRKFLRSLFEFLEVDATFQPNMSKRHNTTQQVQKNVSIHDFLTQDNLIKKLLRPLIPARIRQPLAAKAYRANIEAPPKLTPQLRRQLLPRFQADILATQDLIQRDLSHWLTVD
jgi:hypothetical protein